MASRNVTRLTRRKPTQLSPVKHYIKLDSIIDHARAVADLLSLGSEDADARTVTDASFLLFELMSEADDHLDALWESTRPASAERAVDGAA